jgi:hypothetical protein
LSKSALQSALAADGLMDDKSYSKVSLSLPVALVAVDAQASTLVSGAALPLTYSATPGKTGIAKGGL